MYNVRFLDIRQSRQIYDGGFWIHDHGKTYPPVVCMFCFNNPKKTLFNCVVGIHKNNVSNFMTQLEKKHSKEPKVQGLKLPCKKSEEKAANKVAAFVCSKNSG
jgi:hypothetical protein